MRISTHGSIRIARRWKLTRNISSEPEVPVDRKAFEECTRSLLCCNFTHELNWNNKNDLISTQNVMLQNLRALQFLGRNDLSQAESCLEQCIEVLRGPMMGTTSDSYVDMGGILVDLAVCKSDKKDMENTLKRAYMMISKSYKVNTHLSAGVQANLCEFYRRNLKVDQSTSMADQLLLSLNSSHGGHEMSTKSRWGGEGLHGHNYDFLWSDLCASDLRSAQYYFTVGRCAGNFRSASEACIHFNRGFQALIVHYEAFVSTRINGVPEMEAVGGSLAHMLPTFVEGCIDLATVKAISSEKKMIIVDKVDHLERICELLVPEHAPQVGISSTPKDILTLVRSITAKPGEHVSQAAIDYLLPSLRAAEESIASSQSGTQENGAEAAMQVGNRYVTGLALLDARFHLS
jgi:hypothetical protein